MPLYDPLILLEGLLEAPVLHGSANPPTDVLAHPLRNAEVYGRKKRGWDRLVNRRDLESPSIMEASVISEMINHHFACERASSLLSTLMLCNINCLRVTR